MATGSGKTRTALAAAARCPDLSLLVVAVPSSALVEQWADELRRRTCFRSPVLVYESSTRWQESLFNRLRAARRYPPDRPVVAIGTLNSLSSDKFASVLSDADLPGNSLLIADEMHNAGAPTYRRALRSEFTFRLGLSATPARYFDEQGTRVLQQYFGPTVFTYDMRRAIEDGRLCPYRYFVYPAHFSEDEFHEYQQLTQRIVLLRSQQAGDVTFRTDNLLDGDSPEVEQLLFRRARILKKCSAKLDALAQALSEHPMKRGLVYCADNEQLDAAKAVLDRFGIVHLTYTAETPPDQRRSALDALGRGHVAVIAAIDCLDEGVDVPSVNEAIILASSSNKRQFIQRRGRILRNAPGKRTATLIDVIALPPQSAGRDGRAMLKGELARVKEMAELAVNRFDVLVHVKRCAAPFGVSLAELLSGEGDG